MNNGTNRGGFWWRGKMDEEGGWRLFQRRVAELANGGKTEMSMSEKPIRTPNK